MKKTICALVLLSSLSIACFAQPFQGKITYQNTFKSKVPNVTDEMFTQMMGTSSEYLVKNGNYRTNWTGTFLIWQIYIQKDNKLYSKFSNSPSIFWNDGAENKDEVVKSELNKNVLDVLGHKCDELVLTCKSGIQKYYFNSKFKMDPKQFENHKFGNFYDYVVKSKAVPLKIMIDNAQFTMESVASSIEEGTPNDSTFVLPPDAALEKNPYN